MPLYKQRFRGDMPFNFSAFKKTWSIFLPFIFRSSSRNRSIAALGLILLDIAVVSLVPFYAKYIVDGLSDPLTAESTLLVGVILLGVFWTLEKVASHVQEIVFFPVVNTAIRDLTSQVIQHIHHIPLADHQTLSSAEIISCIKRISMSARTFIKIFFLMIIPTCIKLVITTVICIKMGSFGFALLPGISLSLWLLYKGTQKYIESRDSSWEMTDAVTMRVNDSIINTKLVRFFVEHEIKSVEHLLQQEATLWNKTNIRLHTLHLAIGIILGLTITLILYKAMRGVALHTLTLGDFVMLKAQLMASFLPLKTLSMEFRQLAESVIDIKKIRHILEIPMETTFKISTQRTTFKDAGDNRHEPEILLDNISFEYEPKRPLLTNVSFSAGKNDKIALEGDNGNGKSSLLAIMSGLTPTKLGGVYIQGKSPRDYTRQQFSRILHFIPQDVRLFNLSLRENILYGLNNSPSQLYDMIDLCGLNTLVTNAVDGLETKVGDMGIRLSGGEKQRIALARALLLNPDILLMDETLDSLNIENEQEVLQTIVQSISTIVVVSHHPYLLKMMDKVLTLKHGQLCSRQEGALEETRISSASASLRVKSAMTPSHEFTI